jgi:hypothetical protein
MRDDVDSEGSVLERAIEDGLKLAAVGVFPGLKPERWRSADCPEVVAKEFDCGCAADIVARIGVSLLGDKSESLRSGGGGVARRFSSEIVVGEETCGNRDEGAEEACSDTIVEARDRCTAAS